MHLRFAEHSGFSRPRREDRMIEQPQALNQHLAKRLLAYAAMAGAGIAASTSPATAEIVYTPTHKNIDMDFYLDLNHDGIGDFHIHSYYLSGSPA